jgi:hypothetical protein
MRWMTTQSWDGQKEPAVCSAAKTASKLAHQANPTAGMSPVQHATCRRIGPCPGTAKALMAAACHLKLTEAHCWRIPPAALLSQLAGLAPYGSAVHRLGCLVLLHAPRAGPCASVVTCKRSLCLLRQGTPWGMVSTQLVTAGPACACAHGSAAPSAPSAPSAAAPCLLRLPCPPPPRLTPPPPACPLQGRAAGQGQCAYCMT